MNPSIAIRATGLITPLGHNGAATWRALLAGQYIRAHARAVHGPPAPGTPGKGWGGGCVESGPGMPRVDRLGLIAAREAIDAIPDAAKLLADSRTALVVGTSKGAADEWLDSPAITRPFGLGALTDHLAAALGHGVGPRLTLSGACASGLHALIRAAMLIEHGDADRALVVAAESSMHPLFLQSFRRMGVLPPGDGRCRPFDAKRQGFLVGEAAAAVWLERNLHPSQGDLLIDRFAFAGDAGHLTASDPDGATLRRLLSVVIGGRRIDIVHAHGTGTEANDAAEAAAIDSILTELPRVCRAGNERGTADQEPPAVYSHKGAIGHSLGASGMVSVVLNVMMHRDGVVPPNVGIETPMPLQHATLSRELVLRPVKRSVVCAAGFGGATAAVSLVGSALTDANDM